MKIKSLLSLLVCGVASQFLVSCSSSGPYFDFSTPATTYQKVAPKAPVLTVDAETPAAVVAQAEPVTAPAPVAPAPSPVLEANAAAPVASREVARTAPLTTAAVASATHSNAGLKTFTNDLASATSKKDVKTAVKKMVRDTKSAKKTSALNQYIKIGLILLVAGALLSVISHGLGVIGGIVAIVGLVFILLGLLEM